MTQRQQHRTSQDTKEEVKPMSSTDSSKTPTRGDRRTSTPPPKKERRPLIDALGEGPLRTRMKDRTAPSPSKEKQGIHRKPQKSFLQRRGLLRPSFAGAASSVHFGDMPPFPRPFPCGSIPSISMTIHAGPVELTLELIIHSPV